MHRRSLPAALATTLSLFVVLVVPAAAQEQSPSIVVSHLNGSLYKLESNDVALVASVGDDGILLVDTGFAGTAAAVREALDKLAGGPVRIIINTHGDIDHVGGNAALGSGAMIVAHPSVYQQMGTYFALPRRDSTGLPTMTTANELTIHFNSDLIRLLPVAGAHHAGDLVVHFTRSGVVCLGDLVLTGTFPNANPAKGGDAQRLADVLRELVSDLPTDSNWVSCHGANLTTNELQAYIAMIEATTAVIRQEIAAGRSLTEILQDNPLVPWASWERAEIGLSFADWIGDIYSSLTGPAPSSICEPVTEALVEDGVETAVELYRRLRREEPEGWSFAENELNMLGYQLLQRDLVDEAIAIFQLNVEAFPDAFNTHDSLGEAYMAAHRTETAIASYQRSLELNPDNTNAVAMLKRLRE